MGYLDPEAASMLIDDVGLPTAIAGSVIEDRQPPRYDRRSQTIGYVLGVLAVLAITVYRML